MVPETRSGGFGNDGGDLLPHEIRRRRADRERRGVRIHADRSRGRLFRRRAGGGERECAFVPFERPRTRNQLLGVRLSGAGRRRAHAERIGLLPDREGKRSGECAGIRTARLLGGDLLFGGGELYVLLSGCGACFRGLFPLRDGRRFETRSRECAARREERPAFGAGRFDGLYVPFVRRCGRKDL